MVAGAYSAGFMDPVAAPEIDPAGAQAAFEAGAPLLDVREPKEWEEVHIEGAVLIPLGQLAQRLDEVPRGVPLLVHCRSGARSAQAVEFLRASGRPEAVNVAGGILRWYAEGRPVV